MPVVLFVFDFDFDFIVLVFARVQMISHSIKPCGRDTIEYFFVCRKDLFA